MNCNNEAVCCPPTVYATYDPHSSLSLSDLSDVSFPSGVVFSETITCSWNGDLPYVWAVTAGTLPTGLTLNGGTIYTPFVTLTGTPTVPGDYSFTIRGTDAYGEYAERTYNVEIT